MSESFQLTVTKTVPASAKDLFEAWLDPKALAQFMKPHPSMPEPRVKTDAREGGEFEIVMLAGDKELLHRGEYKTIQRYERLVFTWLSEFTLPSSVVSIDFKQLGPKQTQITLRHEGLPNQESRDNHRGGWSHILDALATRVG